MNSVSSVSPARNLPASWSKSSNSFSRIGMMWPGTFSKISGFVSDPARPLGLDSVLIEVGSMEPTNIPKPRGVSNFLLARGEAGALDDLSALRLERQPGLGPGQQSACNRVRVPARGREGIRRHARALAAPAIDDQRFLTVQAGALRLHGFERNQPRSGDVAGGIFVLGADVHELGAVVDQLLCLGGSDFWHGAGSLGPRAERLVATLARRTHCD